MPVGVEQWRAAVGAIARSAAPKSQSPVGPQWRKWLKASDPVAYKGCIVLLVTIAQLAWSGLQQMQDKMEEKVKEGNEHVSQTAHKGMTQMFAMTTRQNVVLMVTLLSELMILLCGHSLCCDASGPFSPVLQEKNGSNCVWTMTLLPHISLLSLFVEHHWYQTISKSEKYLSYILETLKKWTKFVSLFVVQARLYLGQSLSLLKRCIHCWVWLMYRKCNRKTMVEGVGIILSLLFSNRKKPGLSEVTMIVFVNQMLLMIAGDVEPNPGPDTLTQDDLKTVVNELYSASDDWYPLGIQLNVELSELNMIETQHAYRHKKCLIAMLSIWLNKTDHYPPTWQRLVDALSSRSVGQQGIAEKIKKTYCTEDKDEDITQKSVSVESDGLTADDIPTLMNELFEVKYMWHDLGVQLKMKWLSLQGVNDEHGRGLYHMLSRWLSDEKLSPHTWQQVVNALSSPVVDRQDIAERIRKKYCCPDSTEFPESIEPENSSNKQGPSLVQAGGFDVQGISSRVSGEASNAVTHPEASLTHPGHEVEEMILHFDNRFDHLKNTIRECLEKQRVPVMRVIDILTSFPADEDDYRKKFLQSKMSDLFQVADHFELFTVMNFHWTYLDPSLLEITVRKLNLHEVTDHMRSYKSELQQFRMKTPLIQFCQTEKRKSITPPLDFQKSVTEFDWPKNVTLEDVEEFRQGHAWFYSLRDCAMMVAGLLPDSLTGRSTSGTVPLEHRKVSPQGHSPAKLHSGGTVIPSEEAFRFVEQPPDEFFCPVTTGLLLQPYLTSCCGKHLSQEVISRTEKACPLCKQSEWNTMLDKHFQRQVSALHVFCRHEDRGCKWQGNLSAFQIHIVSCPMMDSPQILTLLIDDDKKIIVAGVPLLTQLEFIYTGREMDFIWEEAGISLHFMAASCERDIEMSVGLFTNLEQNCILPQRYQFMPMASATYKILASAPLPAPVKVRIEHCGVVDKEDSLTYMVARESRPPYHFQALDGGHFPLDGSYGEIEMNNFCLLTIFYNVLDSKMTLAVHIAYLRKNVVHFLVTKNIPAHCTAVKKQYQSVLRFDSYTMRYFYGTTKILLSIPLDCKGWCIEPSCRPALVDMLSIHTYQPGSVIPKVELKLNWQGTGQPEEQKVEIEVEGGSMESFTLSCIPEDQWSELILPSQHSLMQDQPNDPQPTTATVVQPQLSDLTLALKDLTWSDVKNMAIQLRLEYATLKQIEGQYSEPSDRLSATMGEWLSSDCNASWKYIVKALKAIGKNVIANEITTSQGVVGTEEIRYT